jgi:hypothetical protein
MVLQKTFWARTVVSLFVTVMLLGLASAAVYEPNSAPSFGGWYEAEAGSSMVYGWTECSDNSMSGGNINDISSNNTAGVYNETTGSSTEYRLCWRLRFEINESPSEVGGITAHARLTANTDPGADTVARKVYLGRTDNTWTEISSDTGWSETYHVGSIASDPENYVHSGNNVYMLVQVTGTHSSAMSKIHGTLRYARLEIAETEPPGNGESDWVQKAHHDFQSGDHGWSGYTAHTGGYIEYTGSDEGYFTSPSLSLGEYEVYRLEMVVTMDRSSITKLHYNTRSNFFDENQYLFDPGSSAWAWKHEPDYWPHVSGVPFDQEVLIVADINKTSGQTNSTLSWSGGGGSLQAFSINNTEHDHIRFKIQDGVGHFRLKELKVYSFTDTQPSTLQITTVQHSGVTNTTATITWNTNLDANSSVNYGTTSSLGTIEDSGTLTKLHSIQLTSLAPETQYFYNVTSCTPEGNCTEEGPEQFVTAESSDEYCDYGVCPSTQWNSTHTYFDIYELMIADAVAHEAYFILWNNGTHDHFVSPKFTGSNVCSAQHLDCNNVEGTCSRSNFQTHSDRMSEIGIVIAATQNHSLFEAWMNTMEHPDLKATGRGNPAECLTANSWQWNSTGFRTINDDSAIDASRKAQAYFIASKNLHFPHSAREQYESLALCIVNESNQYEWANVNLQTPYGFVDRIPFGGQGAANGALGQTNPNVAHMWTGYFEAPVRNNLYAYLITEDESYLDYAKNVVRAFLTVELQHDNGSGFATNAYVGQYDANDGVLEGWKCLDWYILDGKCNDESNQWDRSDRPRGMWICDGVRLANSAYNNSLPAPFSDLNEYCQAALDEGLSTASEGAWNVWRNSVQATSNEAYFNGVSWGMHISYNSTEMLKSKLDQIVSNYFSSPSGVFDGDTNGCKNAFSFEGAHSVKPLVFAMGKDHELLS